jgi:hypothetical protein
MPPLEQAIPAADPAPEKRVRKGRRAPSAPRGRGARSGRRRGRRAGARVGWWLPWWIVLPLGAFGVAVQTSVSTERYARGEWIEGPAGLVLIGALALLGGALWLGAAVYVVRALRGALEPRDQRGPTREPASVRSAWRHAAERALDDAEATPAARKLIESGRAAEVVEGLVARKRAGFWWFAVQFPWHAMIVVGGIDAATRGDWALAARYPVLCLSTSVMLGTIVAAFLLSLFVDLKRHETELALLRGDAAGPRRP